MMKLLILEDDKVTRLILEKSLKFDYILVQCETIKDALKILDSNQDISLCVLDRNLPDGDGIEICKSIRAREDLQHLPIIFLSGNASESEKVLGLISGADDYVSKPFSTLELKARIAARLRNQGKKIYTQDFEIDLESTRVQKRTDSKEELDLTSIEFKLLVCFVKNRDRVLSRQQILSQVWGPDKFYSDRLIDTHISNLRKKLGLCSLELRAVRGSGYLLSESIQLAVAS